MRDVDILVHTTGPSRGPDDTRYRALAQAYLQFVPARRQQLEIVVHVVGGNATRQSERDQQESQKQARQGPESWESYRPFADDEYEARVDEQDSAKSTQETTQGRFAYLQSFGSGQLTFESVDDNGVSPYYQTRLTKRKRAGEESAKLIQSPTKSIPDSQPQAEEGCGNERGLFSSPTKVLELYLQKIDCSQDSPDNHMHRRLEDPEITPTRPSKNNSHSSSSFGLSPLANISRALFRPRAPSPILGDLTPSPASFSENNVVSSPPSQPIISGNRQLQEPISEPVNDMHVTPSALSNDPNEWITWPPTERQRARQPATAEEVSVIEEPTPEGLCGSPRVEEIEEVAHVSIRKLREKAKPSSFSDIDKSKILETVPRKTIAKSLLREKDVPSASRMTSRLQVQEFATPIVARKLPDMARKASWNTPVTSGPRIEETQFSVLKLPRTTILTFYSSPGDRIPETPYPDFPSAHLSTRKYSRMDLGNEQVLGVASSDTPEEHVHPPKRPRMDITKEPQTAEEGNLPSSSAESTREAKRPRGFANAEEIGPIFNSESSPLISSIRQNLMEAKPESVTTSGARDLQKDREPKPSELAASSTEVVEPETSIPLSSIPSLSQQRTAGMDKKILPNIASVVITETPEQPPKKFLSFTGLPDEPELTSSMPNPLEDNEEELPSSSDQQPSSSPIIPQVERLLRIRPTPVMDSYLAVDWLCPPHPPTGTAPIDPETFITPMFHEIVEKFPINKLYHPATQTREIEPLCRGFWRVDCSSWDQAVKEKAWNTMGSLIASRFLGWGVSCCRYSFENEGEKIDNGWDVFRCYCWGIQVPHVYCMLFMASQNKVARVQAEWMVVRTNVVVTMPVKEKNT